MHTHICTHTYAHTHCTHTTHTHMHRGISAGIYTASISEACQFVVSDCRASVVVVENEEQLAKILHVSKSGGVVRAIGSGHG